MIFYNSSFKLRAARVSVQPGHPPVTAFGFKRNRVPAWARPYGALLAVLTTTLGVFSVDAVTLQVTSVADSGAGTLRAVLAGAAAGSTITFAPALSASTITLTSGELVVNKNLVIEGPLGGTLTISGNNVSRVFRVDSGSVTFSHLQIANGKLVGASGAAGNIGVDTGAGGGGAGGGGGALGAGMLVDTNAVVTLSNVIFANNSVVGGNGGNGGGSSSTSGAPGGAGKGAASGAIGSAGGVAGCGAPGGAGGAGHAGGGGGGGRGCGAGGSGGAGSFGGGGGGGGAGGYGGGGTGGSAGFLAGTGATGAYELTGGGGGGGAGLGAGLFVWQNSVVKLFNVTFQNNTATGGNGGNNGGLTGAKGNGKGAAMFVHSNAVVRAEFLTFSGNVSANGGSDVFATDGLQKDNTDLYGKILLPNKAPVLANSTASLPVIDSLTNNIGDSVANLLSASQLNASDTNGDFVGAAVTAVMNQNGSWEYSLGTLSLLEYKTNTVAGISNMDAPSATALSRDGNYLYVASQNSTDSIIWFSRNLATGKLTYSGTVLKTTLADLDNPAQMVISPDDKFLYVVNSVKDSLLTFSRNAANGSLTLVQTLRDTTQTGGTVAGMDAPNGIAISPDGNQVYVTSLTSPPGGVVTFNRNATSGLLTFLNKIADSAASRLASARGVTVSPDGKHVYVTSASENGITLFNRNAGTGALSEVSTTTTNSTTLTNLSSLGYLTVSPDGKSLYVAVSSGHTLLGFDRDSTNGALVLRDKFVNGSNGYNTLSSPYAVEVSPDNRWVLLTGNLAINLFSRNTNNGALALLGSLTDVAMGTLGATRLASFSPDSTFAYLPSFADDSINVLLMGGDWASFTNFTGSVDLASQARLLPPTARIRFNPNAGYSGRVNAGLTLRAWDRDSDTAYGTSDLSVAANSGGYTSYSTQSATLSVQVGASVPLMIADVSKPADAFHPAGQNLDFTVTFNQVVTVNTAGGTPFIGLTLGTASRNATYISGSGTPSLLFRYTIASGDYDADGIGVASSISLNGGTLQDGSGNSAGTTFDAPITAGVRVDALAPGAPVILGISPDTGKSASDGWTRNTTFQLQGTAEANSSVSLSMTGAGLQGTTTANGSGAWSFPLTSALAEGNYTFTAVATDAAGNASVASTGYQVVVDITAPTISVSAPSLSLVAGTTAPVTYSVTYNGYETTDLNAAKIVLNKTGSATAAVSVSGSAKTYTVTLSNLTGAGTLGISLLADTAVDLAGNSAAASAPSATVQVQLSVPSITGVVAPTNASYRAAQALDYVVNFSEALTVTGTPVIGLTLGTNAANAAYLSGSGTTRLLFRYVVQAGDNATNGIRSHFPIVLEGGSIRSQYGTDATLSATEPDTTQVLVDTTAPQLSIEAQGALIVRDGPLQYLLIYSGADSFTLTPNDLSLLTTDTASATVTVEATANTHQWLVTLSGIAGKGTLGIAVAAGTAADVAGNLAPAVTATQHFTLNTPPSLNGTLAGQAVSDIGTVAPFAATTLVDPDLPAQAITLTVDLDNRAIGSFTPASITASGLLRRDGGDYGMTGTAGELTAALRALVFAPVANRGPRGFSETATFSVSLNDQVEPVVIDSDTTVIVTVANHPPAPVADAISRMSRSPTKVLPANLLKNDTDLDRDTLTLTGVSATSALGANVYISGKWIYYSPPAELSSSDSFTYTVTDGQGGTSTGTVSVSVTFSTVKNISTIEDLGGGNIRITFDGIPGRLYTFQVTSDLANPTWQTIGAGATADAQGVVVFEDSPGTGTRFYRAVLP